MKNNKHYVNPNPTHGLLSPSVFMNLNTNQFDTNLLYNTIVEIEGQYKNEIGDFVDSHHIKGLFKPKSTKDINALTTNLSRAISIIQQICNLGIFESPIIFIEKTSVIKIIIPTPNLHTEFELKLYVNLFHLLMDNSTIKLNSFKHLMTEVTKLFKTGSNTNRFIHAATYLRIPHWRVDKDIIRYGQGSRTRWMESTFTDETSIIGSKIARNKLICSNVLAKAGFPVSQKQIVMNHKQAISFAQKVEFPVVLKPAGLDGGVGVHPHLTDEDSIKKAFISINKISNKILIEKHIYGTDYRIQVVNGKSVWVVERRPPYVIGDGTKSINELVKDENISRAVNKKTRSLRPINLDSESENSLKQYQYTFTSVPKKNEQVKLKNIANVNTGGYPVAIEQNIHPDNLKLAEDAAALLGLDIAGVDLILEDINKSWHGTSGIICEVNAQPQFGFTSQTHLYKDTLLSMMPQLGRIPIILVLPNSNSVKHLMDLKSRLADKGVNVSLLNTTLNVETNISHLISKEIAKTNIDAVFVFLNRQGDLKSGFGVDRFDYIIIDDDNVNNTPKINNFITQLRQLNMIKKLVANSKMINKFKHQKIKIIDFTMFEKELSQQDE